MPAIPKSPSALKAGAQQIHILKMFTAVRPGPLTCTQALCLKQTTGIDIMHCGAGCLALIYHNTQSVIVGISAEWVLLHAI